MRSQRKYPTVSLIVVVRNEVGYIEKVLDSFANQKYPSNLLEIIMVDGMSDDGTREKGLAKLDQISQRGIKTKMLDNLGLTLSKGWNIAIKQAKGDIVCRADAHSELSQNYIISGVEFLLKNMNKKNLVVGGILLNDGHGVLGKTIADFFSSRFGVGNSAFRLGVPSVTETDTAVFALYWREIFSKWGYFDEALGRNQDIEFHTMLREKSYQLFTHPEMKAKYYIRTTLKKLLCKAFNDGYWVFFLRRSALRHKAPMFFTLYFVIALIGGLIVSPPLNLLLFGPLFLYLVLAIVFAIKDGSNLCNKILMLGLFAPYHFAYGLGSLWGVLTILFKFPSRRKVSVGKPLAGRKA